MAIGTIANGESGLSVRTKLNQCLTVVGTNYPYSTTATVLFVDGSGNFINDPNFYYDTSNRNLVIQSSTTRSSLQLYALKSWYIMAEKSPGAGELIFYDATDNKSTLALDVGQFTMYSTVKFGWNNDASYAYSGSMDTALYRNAAGVVEINNGTPGTYRDLIVRNLTVTGTGGGGGGSGLGMSFILQMGLP